MYAREIFRLKRSKKLDTEANKENNFLKLQDQVKNGIKLLGEI